MPQTILQNIFVKKLCKNGKTPSADRGTCLQRALYGIAFIRNGRSHGCRFRFFPPEAVPRTVLPVPTRGK